MSSKTRCVGFLFFDWKHQSDARLKASNEVRIRSMELDRMHNNTV